jgi:DNA mismatch repair protein MutS
MRNDRTTLKDLSIFSSDGQGSVFALLDRTVTQAGRDVLRRHVQHPPATYEALAEMQDVVRFWMQHSGNWPEDISNGTLVMLERFFESADHGSRPPRGLALLLGSLAQKLLNRNEYFFTQFSVSHLSDLMRGCRQLTALLADAAILPDQLRRELEEMEAQLQHPLVDELVRVHKATPYTTLLRLSYRARRELKPAVQRLMHHYARLDAWRSMALASLQHGWALPELLPALPAQLEAEGLSHPLLPRPVAYPVAFSPEQHFMVLTGANMSGKTTFMRALGVGALLAHLGMGVPARRMKISFLQGIITNMHVEDNILRGESYFFAEVQRMKQTARQLTEPAPHLVLMDELFKGTNVHDAYECTRAVIEGLLLHPHHLMILSTHLYEVAQHFSAHPRIRFAYFMTQMGADGSFDFSYELRQGISNDRIGYRILQQEGVLDLLRQQK